MGIAENVVQALGSGSQIVRGRVTGLDPSARVLVCCDGDAATTDRHCDVLRTGIEALVYEPGDEVLVLLRREAESDGIVLGRVGRALAAAVAEPAVTPRVVPPTPGASAVAKEKRVVIEADEELILRVGDSSIRISSDGKVVIRGEHVLSRAKGTNRIKGGSVAIN